MNRILENLAIRMQTEADYQKVRRHIEDGGKATREGLGDLSLVMALERDYQIVCGVRRNLAA